MSEFVPAGRLTLTSDAPVMTTDAVNATIVYYAPYVGNIIPLYNGSNYTNRTFTLLTLPLEATKQAAGSLYDVFAFLDVNESLTIGFGPAWTSSSARGTGAGTTELARVNGLLLNANAMTLNNCATTYNIGANRGTYLGTVATTTGTAGQTAMQFEPSAAAGGTNNWLGVWNAYNRVLISSVERDANRSWSYNSGTWRVADAGGTGSGLLNRITWVDGLAQSHVHATYKLGVQAAVSGGIASVGVWFNATSGTPGGYIASTLNNSSTGMDVVVMAEDRFVGLGRNFVQAAESASTSTNYFGQNISSAPGMQLALLLSM